MSDQREFMSIEEGRRRILGTGATHAYEAIDDWLEGLLVRDRNIFLIRLSPLTPFMTLQETGDIYGVSRECIRQLVIRRRREMEEWLRSQQAAPVHAMAEVVRSVLGAAAPSHRVESLLAPVGAHRDHRGVILGLAGPYLLEGAWHILESAVADDPIDEPGLDQEFARRRLLDWGMNPAWVNLRLRRPRHIRRGQPTSFQNRMATSLESLGRPATIAEIMEHANEIRPSFRGLGTSELKSDARFRKVSKALWSLASWSLPEYRGVVFTIRDVISSRGGRMLMRDLINHMLEIYQTAGASTVAHSSSPFFIARNGHVRLRRNDDPPYQRRRSAIRRTKGCYRLGPNRVAKLLPMNRLLLSGAGYLPGTGVGAVLGIEFGEVMTFEGVNEETFRLSFPLISVVDVYGGSVRQTARRLGAVEGDLFTLILDGTDMSLDARIADPGTLLSSWQTVGRLSGLAEDADLDGLAEMLDCSSAEVYAVLRARRDPILGFLPEIERERGVIYIAGVAQDEAPPWRRAPAPHGVSVDPRLLQQARIRTGVSMQEAAERLGVSPAMVRNHEAGRRHPSYDALHGYAALYGVTVESVLPEDM